MGCGREASWTLIVLQLLVLPCLFYCEEQLRLSGLKMCDTIVLCDVKLELVERKRVLGGSWFTVTENLSRAKLTTSCPRPKLLTMKSCWTPKALRFLPDTFLPSMVRLFLTFNIQAITIIHN